MAGRKYEQLPLSLEHPALWEVHLTREERWFAVALGAFVGLAASAAKEAPHVFGPLAAMGLVIVLPSAIAIDRRIREVRGKRVGLGKEVELFVGSVLKRT